MYNLANNMKKYFIHLTILIISMSNTIMAQEMSRQSKINELLSTIINSEDHNISWELDSLINIKLNNNEFKDALNYITNNRNLKNDTEAYDGLLGRMNSKRHKRRKKIFEKLISNNWRDNKTINGKDKKVILAEGDSWFVYPLIIKDILNHLIREDNYAIFSIAYGGDWLANIIKEETYLDEYEKYVQT